MRTIDQIWEARREVVKTTGNLPKAIYLGYEDLQSFFSESTESVFCEYDFYKSCFGIPIVEVNEAHYFRVI